MPATRLKRMKQWSGHGGPDDAFDLETTSLVDKRVPINDMVASVACATVLYAPELTLPRASEFTFWHADADGAPISLRSIM